MQLTEKQIQQANDLIKRYGFCTLETQKELQENGFFEKAETAHKLYLQKSSGFVDSETHKGMQELGGNQIVLHENRYDKTLFALPMPQFHEVWSALPEKLELVRKMHEKGNIYKPTYDEKYTSRKTMRENVGYENSNGTWAFSFGGNNSTEAACQLWLKLKKENLL